MPRSVASPLWAASSTPGASPRIRSFRPMSEVLWHRGLAVDLEPEPEVPASRHDDRDVHPDLHVTASRLDAALGLARVALGDVVAVLGLEGVARGARAAALAGRGAG